MDNENKALQQEMNDFDKRMELAKMVEKADAVVLGFTGTTAATGAIPIPFADMPLLIGQQVAMMAAVCGVFKINIQKDGLKALATAAIGAGGAAVLGKTVATNLMKLVPGAGTIAGGAISAGTAGVITLAMGKAFIEVCKANKMGVLSEAELTSGKGKEMLKAAFKQKLKEKKK